MIKPVMSMVAKGLENRPDQQSIAPAALGVLFAILILGLAVLLLSGCNFWTYSPEGQLLRISIPEQEVASFLSRFTTGLSQLRRSLRHAPQLGELLRKVETSFRGLDRAIGLDSPAHPVDLEELHRALAALIRELKAYPPEAGLAPALATARELQRLLDQFALRIQAELELESKTALFPLGPEAPPEGDGEERQPPSISGPALGCSSHRHEAVQRMATLVEEFNAILGELGLVLNAANAHKLVYLLDRVRTSLRKIHHILESGSLPDPSELSSLKERVSLLVRGIEAFPCRGTRSRVSLDRAKELQRLVEALMIELERARARASSESHHDEDEDEGRIEVLRAHIAGGDRVVCLDDPYFSARGSTGRIVRYLWDFGDGHTASGFTVSHEYRRPGDYRVTLTVVDYKGRTAMDSIMVFVRYCIVD